MVDLSCRIRYGKKTYYSEKSLLADYRGNLIKSFEGEEYYTKKIEVAYFEITDTIEKIEKRAGNLFEESEYECSGFLSFSYTVYGPCRQKR